MEYKPRTSKQRYSEASQKRLEAIITKKIETTFIGALDSFEKYFGFLWGNDKEEEDLTQDELEMDDLWQQARTEVLNKGNKQLRAAQQEIENNTVSWNKYHYSFNVRKDNNGNQ